MRPTATIIGISCLILVNLAAEAPAAYAQSWSPPPPEERCPSRWGAGDELGAVNHMGPETVLRAAGLIREGRVIELGQVLSSDMPLGGTRHFDLYMKPTRMSPESNAGVEISGSGLGETSTGTLSAPTSIGSCSTSHWPAASPMPGPLVENRSGSVSQYVPQPVWMSTASAGSSATCWRSSACCRSSRSCS